MNGMNRTLKSFYCWLLLFLLLATQANATNLWPDRIEPSVSIHEALRLARSKVMPVESDNLYCLNATLLNSDEGDTRNGYWLISLATELGNNYSVAVRMDRKVSVRKVKEFRIQLPNPWPERITPPISVESALATAEQLLSKQNKRTAYYCLNATLVTGSRNVVKDGMWNFVYQSDNNKPKLVNIRMNGKTSVKSINKIEQLETGY
jgi:hypothetical protein